MTVTGISALSKYSKRETATAEDSESLLKIRASGYYDFLTYDFPRLETLASSIFCAPATTAGVERFFSVAGHIWGIRRTRLSNENHESMLFAKVDFDLYDT